MPARPFPLPYSIGIDICHIPRIHLLLNKATRATTSANGSGHQNQRQRFLNRFLSRREQQELHVRFPDFIAAQSNNGSNDSGVLAPCSTYLAGRWAAKEATIKAVSWRKLSFLDVHIGKHPNGRGVCAVVLDEPAASADTVNGTGTNRDDSTPNDAEGPTNDSFSETYAGRISRGTSSDSSKLIGATDADLEDSLEGLSGSLAQLSISHDGDYATAVCLAAPDADARNIT